MCKKPFKHYYIVYYSHLSLSNWNLQRSPAVKVTFAKDVTGSWLMEKSIASRHIILQVSWNRCAKGRHYCIINQYKCVLRNTFFWYPVSCSKLISLFWQEPVLRRFSSIRCVMASWIPLFKYSYFPFWCQKLYTFLTFVILKGIMNKISSIVRAFLKNFEICRKHSAHNLYLFPNKDFLNKNKITQNNINNKLKARLAKWANNQ